MHWVGYRAVKSLVCGLCKKNIKKPITLLLKLDIELSEFPGAARFYQRVFNMYVLKWQINYLFIYLFYLSPIEMMLNVEL